MSGSVLIVDDSRTILSVVRVYLSGNGYQFFSADNGPAGLEIALRERPDVIISDLKMEPMSGIELCRRVRASPQLAHTAVILMTGTRDKLEQDQGRVCGCDGFLTKPIGPKLMLAEVARVIACRRKATQ